MPLRIVFTLFLFLGAFEMYSQVYLGSGNLELISTDASKGKFILRLRFFTAVNNFEPISDVIRIYGNSDGKLVKKLPTLKLINPPTSSEIIANGTVNLRCDSNLINNQDYLLLLRGIAFSKEGIYEDTLTLDPNIYTDPQGYTLTTQSFDVYLPNGEYTNFLDKTPIIGVVPAKPTIVLKIPPFKDVSGNIIKNSSPEFSTYKQEYLCRGRPFSMIVGCRDADNDELRYSLVHPYAGFVPDGLVTWLRDLQLQAFKPGYSMNNYIDGSINIDAKTGLLSVLPTKWGTYLVCIKVEQIRAGTVIGFTYKYYSFMVRECKKADDPQPKLTPAGYPSGTNEVTVCKGQPITLNSQSNPNWAYEWSKDGFVIQGETSPTLTIKDKGLYEVKVRVKYPINNININDIEEGCSNINKERITVNVLGVAGSEKLSGAKSFCNGGFSTLQAPAKAYILYQWYKDGVAIPSATTSVYDATQVGKYWAVLTDITSPTCPSNTDTLDLKFSTEQPKIKILSDGKKTLCQEGGSINLKINPSGTETIKWFKDGVEISGQILANFTLTQTGKYTVELKDNTTKCTTLGDTINVTLAPKPTANIASVGNQQQICTKDSLQLFTTLLPKGSYQWKYNGTDITGATKELFFAKNKGDYEVSVIDSSGCKNLSQKFTLDTVSKITVKLDPLSDICVDRNAVLLNGYPANGQFSGTGIQNGKFDPKLTGSGIFTITYTINTGMQCQRGTANQLIKVNALPNLTALPPSVTVSKGNSVLLNSGNITGYTYSWTPPTFLDSGNKGNPIAKPDQTTEYTVKITSDKGCVAYGKIKVIVSSKILIPNVFSPNADGDNDTWVLFGIENYPESEVFVYNRWGELVFYSKGYASPFDGKYDNGTELPVDSYAYKINIVRPLEDGYVLKGAVTILR
jgi:gliding motility-associated-like protein